MSRSFHPRRPKSDKARASWGLPPRKRVDKIYQWTSPTLSWTPDMVIFARKAAENAGLDPFAIHYQHPRFMIKCNPGLARRAVAAVTKILGSVTVDPDWDLRS